MVIILVTVAIIIQIIYFINKFQLLIDFLEFRSRTARFNKCSGIVWSVELVNSL